MCVKMPWAVLLGFSLLTVFGSFMGCSKASFYPALGATGGAAVGSLGGPGPAAGGAALGWGVGEVAKYTEENAHLTKQVKALTEGDIKQLVNNQLDESMDNGFFDSMLTEIYGLLKVCLIGVVLWNVIPIIYTRYVHKKAKNTVSNEKTT
jgi:hypothetical protein